MAKKPMIGFDTALALTGVIAGQQDCKFANMIITEYEDHYEVGVIDFELSGTSYFGKIFNRHEYTTHLPSLVHYIRELHDQNDEFNLVKFKLSGDPRGREFVQYALSHAMNEENVINLYRKIAETDFITPSIARLESLYSENTGLVTRSEIRAWKAELTRWQSEALRFVQEYDEEHRSACRV